ncbi:hypothetical protein EYZ11_006801 [Aspergillus tanneri]|uniref:Uncharacterized protein n=1 Tax=Aspergillus tanneri TaxID=1220188 RepID=A0A4S3JF26_9EURO|nr:hypothetical protein EYZ11_006801 [Aspergillus tanneri]
MAHGQAVNAVSRFRGEKYDKLEFLYDIDKIRKRALTERTIRAGWREVGIRPWNPSLILQKLGGTAEEEEPLKIYDGDHIIENFKDITVSTTTATTTTTTTTATVQRTPSPPREEENKTPTTLRSFRKEVVIYRRLKIELSPSVDRLLRGGLTQAEKYAMSSIALDEALASKKRPSNSTTRTRRWVHMDGLIYAKDVNRHIEEKKFKEAQKRWKSTLKRHQREAKALMERIAKDIDEAPTPTPASAERDKSEDLWFIDLEGDPDPQEGVCRSGER